MPVFSSSSRVMRWPNRTEVDAAVREWACEVEQLTPDILALGYFGSYARGDWGFGSDVDVVAVLQTSDVDYVHRRLTPLQLDLPVPADVLIYTQDEFAALRDGSPHFARVMLAETTWLFGEHAARELLA